MCQTRILFMHPCFGALVPTDPARSYKNRNFSRMSVQGACGRCGFEVCIFFNSVKQISMFEQELTASLQPSPLKLCALGTVASWYTNIHRHDF